MDWNTFFIATIPAFITGLISYLSASKNTKTEINKAKINQETAFKTIEANHKLAIDTIEKNALHEIEKMKNQTIEEIQLYNAKSQTDLKSVEDKMILEETQKMFSSLLVGGDFDGFQNKLEGLQKLSEKFNPKG